MKLPIKVEAVVTQDKVLGEIVDIKFTVPPIPFETDGFDIVPIRGARLTNFETATILMARNMIAKYPEFQNASDSTLARQFRNEFIYILAELSESGMPVFQGLVDRPKDYEPKRQQPKKVENLLEEMGRIDDDVEDIIIEQHVEEFKKKENIFEHKQPRSYTEIETPKPKQVSQPTMIDTEKEEIIESVYSESTDGWKTETNEKGEKVNVYNEGSGSGKNITTFVVNPGQRTIGKVGIPNPDAKAIKKGVYRKPSNPDFEYLPRKGAGFKQSTKFNGFTGD